MALTPKSALQRARACLEIEGDAIAATAGPGLIGGVMVGFTTAKALALAPGARVQTAVRVRLIAGQPFSYLTTHVPEPIARNYSESDLATTPLFRLLECSGVRIESAAQSVTATLATPETAEALGVSVGGALLGIDRVVQDDAGQGVEYLSALYRPDMFRLDVTLSRVGAKGKREWAPMIGKTRAKA